MISGMVLVTGEDVGIKVGVAVRARVDALVEAVAGVGLGSLPPNDARTNPESTEGHGWTA